MELTKDFIKSAFGGQEPNRFAPAKVQILDMKSISEKVLCLKISDGADKTNYCCPN